VVHPERRDVPDVVTGILHHIIVPPVWRKRDALERRLAVDPAAHGFDPRGKGL
jgi:hypothetical protein